MALVEHKAASSNVNKQNVHTSSDYDLAVHLQAVPEEELAFAVSREQTIRCQSARVASIATYLETWTH
jgi:hypothetical protein